MSKKLREYKIPRSDAVPSDGEKYPVRGLSLSDLIEGFGKFRSEMEALYGGLLRGDLNLADQEEAIYQGIRVAPNLCAHLIALACDDPDSADIVRGMPLADQVAFAMPIIMLTLDDGLVLKKATEAASQLQTRLGRGTNPRA